MRYVGLFCRFWYDFIVGDDWKIAAGVVAAIAIGAILAGREAVPDAGLAVLIAGAIVLVVVVSVIAGALVERRRR